MQTLEVKKGLKVPIAVTLGALEDFGVENNVALSDLAARLTNAIGQRDLVASLLYYIVKAGFEELGEKMNYTKENASEWMKGRGIVNLPLLNATLILVYDALIPYEEPQDEEPEPTKN